VTERVEPSYQAGQLVVTGLVDQVFHLGLGPHLFTWPQEEEGAGPSSHASQHSYRYRYRGGPAGVRRSLLMADVSMTSLDSTFSFPS
jgi:hypothetical protein